MKAKASKDISSNSFAYYSFVTERLQLWEIPRLNVPIHIEFRISSTYRGYRLEVFEHISPHEKRNQLTENLGPGECHLTTDVCISAPRNFEASLSGTPKPPQARLGPYFTSPSQYDPSEGQKIKN